MGRGLEIVGAAILALILGPIVAGVGTGIIGVFAPEAIILGIILVFGALMHYA